MYILCIKPELGVIGTKEKYLSIYDDYYVFDTDDGVTELISGVDIYNLIADFGRQTTEDDLEYEGLDTSFDEDGGNEDYDEVQTRLTKEEFRYDKFRGVRIYLDEPEFLCVTDTLYTLLTLYGLVAVNKHFFMSNTAVYLAGSDSDAIYTDIFMKLYRGGLLKEKRIDAYTDFYIWYVGFERDSLEVRAVGEFFHSVEECEALVKFNLPDFWRIERLCIDDIDFDASENMKYKAELAKHVLAFEDISFNDKRELSYKACLKYIRGISNGIFS